VLAAVGPRTRRLVASTRVIAAAGDDLARHGRQPTRRGLPSTRRPSTALAASALRPLRPRRCIHTRTGGQDGSHRPSRGHHRVLGRRRTAAPPARRGRIDGRLRHDGSDMARPGGTHLGRPCTHEHFAAATTRTRSFAVNSMRWSSSSMASSPPSCTSTKTPRPMLRLPQVPMRLMRVASTARSGDASAATSRAVSARSTSVGRTSCLSVLGSLGHAMLLPRLGRLTVRSRAWRRAPPLGGTHRRRSIRRARCLRGRGGRSPRA
jgi:hypothetical protein